MSKLIRLDDRITNATAPFVNLKPGVSAYTDRYIASHVAGPVGSTVSAWPSADVGSTLSQTPGGTGPITIQEEGTLRFLRAPGGGGQGRVLGDKKGTLPFTIAALIRAPYAGSATAGILGVSGTAITRSSGGFITATGGTTLNSGITETNWMFVLLQVDSGKTMTLRVGSTEVSGVTTLTPPASSNGIYFGPSSAASADIAELVYWPIAMSLEQRTAVHDYMRSQYSVLS